MRVCKGVVDVDAKTAQVLLIGAIAIHWIPGHPYPPHTHSIAK